MTAPAAAAIDLNADLGEGYGDWSMGEDAAMLDVVTTANIACGGHAGDARSMRAACRAAAARGVAITAHVAYPDLQGFGRRSSTSPPRTSRTRWSCRSGHCRRWPGRRARACAG